MAIAWMVVRFLFLLPRASREIPCSLVAGFETGTLASASALSWRHSISVRLHHSCCFFTSFVIFLCSPFRLLCVVGGELCDFICHLLSKKLLPMG